MSFRIRTTCKRLALLVVLSLADGRLSTVQAQDCDDGECRLAPIACDTHADCPRGLECETTRIGESCQTSPAGDGDAAIPNDGACTREEFQLEEPECIYVPVLCTQDNGCEPFHACQLLGSESECHSEPARCPSGETCDAPSEPVCTQSDLRFCFPVRVDCTDSSECMDGWRCATLPENAFADHPDGWEGATAICAPEGIALLLEGRVEVRSESSSSVDRASANGDAIPGADDELGEQDAEMREGASSCSVGRPAQSSASDRKLGVLGLLLVAIAFCRRQPASPDGP